MDIRNAVTWALNGNKGLTLVVVISLVTVSHIPLAVSNSLPSNPPTPLPVMPFDNNTTVSSVNLHQSPFKFNKYIKDKYKVIDAESRVKQTLNGPSGDIWINGDMKPIKKPIIDKSLEKDMQARARATAKAFMDDEPVLLGIIDPQEIRESNIGTNPGFGGDYTHISYQRYINGIKLQGAGIHLTIGPNENISSVIASLEAVPPQAYDATKEKTLSEEEIRIIVEDDLTEADKSGYDMNSIYKSFNKVAITKPPYIKWDVHCIYLYEIDAFTGKILSKVSPIIKEPVIPEEDSSANRDTLPPMPPPVMPQK